MRLARRAGAKWWLAPLFLLHALPFLTRPALVGGDEVHYALLAHSLASDGDLELGDDYEEVTAGSVAAGRKRAGQTLDRHLREVAGTTIPTHPFGVPLLLAPLRFLQLKLAPGAAPDVVLAGATLLLTFAALIAGYEALARLLGDRRRAGFWTFATYFSSPLWFYGRTLFTEPFTWSLAVLALAAAQRRRLLLASGLLGLALLTKESALFLVAPILTGAWLLRDPRTAARLALGPALAVALGVAFNGVRGLPLLTTPQPFRFGDPVAGLLGLLLDGRHGLLAFAPLLLLGGAAGLAAAVRRTDAPRERTVALLAGSAFLGYVVLHALWVDWTGGSCYGPRLLVPALPALALAGAAGSRARRVHALTLALFLCGFVVAFAAALDPWRAFWGATPVELLAARPWTGVLGLGAGLLAWRGWRRAEG